MTREPAALLRALPEGGWLWLEGLGTSMWPLLRAGDAVQVVRCEAVSVTPGDIAVVQRADGGLTAHLVVARAPVRTVSLLGREDAPGEVLGRVVRLRTRGRVLPVPPLARPLLRATCLLAARARSLPALRAVWRWGRGRLGHVGNPLRPPRGKA